MQIEQEERQEKEREIRCARSCMNWLAGRRRRRGEKREECEGGGIPSRAESLGLSSECLDVQ